MRSAKQSEPGRSRGRLTILVKLLAAFAAPTMVLFSLFAIFAYEVSRRDLDAELGTRLSAVAASSALQIRGKYLVDLAAGDEDDRGYQNALRKLESIAAVTGARIYVFDRDFLSRVDTRPGVPIGTRYFQAELDRHEVDQVFDSGRARASVLFEGGDGKRYKAGYAPVAASETEPEIVLVLGVEAPAAYFDRLADLRGQLIFYGALLVLVIIVIATIVASRITRPVRELASAAERIGRGELAAPIERSSRDEIGVLATTMETMRTQLRDRDEHMQLMLSGIAHEVRNPLGGIELFAGILRDELEPGDERASHVARIERELGYLKRVVNEFLEYARRPALELAPVDVAELLSELVDLEAGESLAASAPLALASGRALDNGSLVVVADRGQLRRALLNLVRNAIQASRGVAAPQVTVGAHSDGDSVSITVANRGEPIPEEVRERIFEPFFTTREKGTGLGLAFVREMARAHGGEVELRCSDGTTTFAVRLPREGSHPLARGATRTPEAG